MLTYGEALNQAFKEEMRRDSRVVMWGEDLISMDGVMGHTAGIFDEFGGDRIRDTPICELAIAGMAIGAAMKGLRPVGFFMNAGFMLCAFDGLFLKMGCTGAGLPIVMCGTTGGPWDVDHGMSPEALFAHAPHLKIVLPSTPYDAKGLMKTAIRTDDPVMFFDHSAAFFSGYSDGSSYSPSTEGSILPGGNRQEVPGEEYLIPFGEADIKREGSDITLVTFSFMVHHALEAASLLEKEGVSVEVVDLRTIMPLDVATIVESVKKTGRLLIAHEAMERAGIAGEIAFRVFEEAPDLLGVLKTPFRRLAAENVPITHIKSTPDSADIVSVVKEMV